MNTARMTPTTREERKMKNRIKWKGRGGYADGFTEERIPCGEVEEEEEEEEEKLEVAEKR